MLLSAALHMALEVPTSDLLQHNPHRMLELLQQRYSHHEVNTSFYVVRAPQTSTTVVCVSPKVGTTSFHSMPRSMVRRLDKRTAATHLASSKAIHAVIVRSPLARFESFYRNKVLDPITNCPKALSPSHCSYNDSSVEALFSPGCCFAHSVGLGVINKQFFNVSSKDCRPRSLSKYAMALEQGAHWMTTQGDVHYRSITQQCLLDAIKWDVVGSLGDLDGFSSQIAALGGLKLHLVHSNSGNATMLKRSVDDTRLLTCDATSSLQRAYHDDLVNIARLEGKRPMDAAAGTTDGCQDSPAVLELEALIDKDVLNRNCSSKCSGRCCCAGVILSPKESGRLLQLVHEISGSAARVTSSVRADEHDIDDLNRLMNKHPDLDESTRRPDGSWHKSDAQLSHLEDDQAMRPTVAQSVGRHAEGLLDKVKYIRQSLGITHTVPKDVLAEAAKQTGVPAQGNLRDQARAVIDVLR